MYIEPDSTIQLMKNVPLNSRQTDTFWFGDMATQHSFFSGFVGQGLTFSDQYYQRVNRNYCKLDVNPELIHECNYMRFQNTAFGDKWFYAFILDSDYINNRTAIIHYKIDPIQTWMFEPTTQLKECFVEREHTTTDIAGQNLEKEPVDIGDYYTQVISDSGLFSDMDIIVALGWYEDSENGGEQDA